MNSPPEEGQATAFFYTNQVHNTDQMYAFLKNPNAINAYTTVVRVRSVFCIIVCPLYPSKWCYTSNLSLEAKDSNFYN